MGFHENIETKQADIEKYLRELQDEIETVEIIVYDNDYYDLQHHVEKLKELQDQIWMSNRMGAGLK